VYARFGRSHGVLGVHRVWQRDVHGVDLAQAIVELLVGESMFESIALGEFASFRSIFADDGDQFRVSTSMSERGEDGDLRDMAKSDDRVSYVSCCCHHGLLRGNSRELGAHLVSNMQSEAKGL
jgi:hypothetical protein